MILEAQALLTNSPNGWQMTETNSYSSAKDYYRVELDGSKVWLTYDEVHAVRKDILLYYDENAGEPVNVLLAPGQFNLPYWKYLSFGYKQEWAESERYKKLVEEGCLALLNGIALDLLDEPVNVIRKKWQNATAEEIILYLKQYQPRTDQLQTAKAYLLRSYHFIDSLSNDDLDADGMLKHFDQAAAGRWFDEHIVREYFKHTLTKYRLP